MYRFRIGWIPFFPSARQVLTTWLSLRRERDGAIAPRPSASISKPLSSQRPSGQGGEKGSRGSRNYIPGLPGLAVPSGFEI